MSKCPCVDWLISACTHPFIRCPLPLPLPVAMACAPCRYETSWAFFQDVHISRCDVHDNDELLAHHMEEGAGNAVACAWRSLWWWVCRHRRH